MYQYFRMIEKKEAKYVVMSNELHKELQKLISKAEKIVGDNFTFDKLLKTLLTNVDYNKWNKSLEKMKKPTDISDIQKNLNEFYTKKEEK